MPPVAVAVATFVTSALTAIGASAGIAAVVGNGILALGGAAGLGAAVGAWAVVGSVASAAGLFGHPSLGAVGTSHSPVDFKADPQAGLPYMIGRTGNAGNIVYIDHSGGPGGGDVLPNRFIHMFTVYGGGGPYQSLESFKADDVTVTFDADGATATDPYSGNMWLRTQLGAQPETAMTQAPGVVADGGTLSTWTSSHKLSGKAASWWTLQASEDAYSSGQPKPMAVWKAAKVYDPRLDSTYPGGSGSHRIDDPSTWEWSENPHLHALKWCLGIEENGKKVLGIGARAAAVDIAAFVDGANISDANGWTIGGTVYSNDNKGGVLLAMLQAGGAIPVPLGAQISCVTQHPRVSLATVTSQDMVAPPSIARTLDRKSRINQVIATYRDENFSWQQVEADPVTVNSYVTADGELRSRAVTYALVQKVDQAAQLARYEIEDSREGAPITLPLPTSWLGYKPGDCITVDDEELCLVGQKVLLLKRELDPTTGAITFSCRTETDAKHDAALGTTGVAPPGSDQSTSHGKPAGASVPPGIQVGGEGPLVFTENLDDVGTPADGKIRIRGKRINTAGGRINVSQKVVETPLKTGGLTGVYWLVVGKTDASTRFTGWASATDGPVFIARYYWGAGTWRAFDSAGTAYAYTPAKSDAVIGRLVRRDTASGGIETFTPLFTYSKGRNPDFQVALTAPADGDITVTGVTATARDGTAKPRLRVEASASREGQDIYVRWRDAAGAYPGAEFALDFVAGVYQLDPDAIDPETTWIDAPHAIKQGKTAGQFGGFDGGELLDVETQWREADDIGEVSDWLLTQDVSIPGKTTPPKPAAAVVASAHGGFNRVKVTQAADQDKDWADFLYFRTTDGVVTEGDTPAEIRRGSRWDDSEGTPGEDYIYVVLTRDRSGNVDWDSGGVAADPVTTRLIKAADQDDSRPAAPTGLVLSQYFAADGTPMLTAAWDANSEPDIMDYVMALQRNGSGYKNSTWATTAAEWPVRVGEVCQVKPKARNQLGRATAAFGSVVTRTITAPTAAPAGTIDVSGASISNKADGQIVIRGWVLPADPLVKGANVYAASINSFGSATKIDFVPAPRTHWRDERLLVKGAPWYFWLVPVTVGDVEGSAAGPFNGSSAYIQGTDVAPAVIDASYHLTNALPAGQAIALGSGLSVPIGSRVLRQRVSDGDTIDFGGDLGSLPDVDFLLGGLPSAPAGQYIQAQATSLTSTGCTVSLKFVTPATITAQDTGSGATDATVPHPTIVATGYSVAKGVTPNAYDGCYRIRLGLSFTLSAPTRTGRATIRLFRYNGSSWSKLTDIDFVAAAAGTWSGLIIANFSTDLAMASTDLFGVNLLYLGDGVTAASITSFNWIRFKTQPYTAPATATPNGETATALVWIPSV